MSLTSKKSPKHVWKGDGVLPPDFISPSSETPGEHSREMDALYDFKNKQHEKAMKAPINEDKIRKAGW
tara:strand:- start:381 stop:584 length:204 start_codon:yes stop_codon:yes gene_type:complete